MINYKLNIGDVVTSSKAVRYSCYGLGSCIGLFIQDRLTGHSGGAHIFLPEDEIGPNRYSRFCNVTYAVEEILRQMKAHGSSLQTLRAKIAGGANLFATTSSVGERNGQSLMKHLIDRRIFIAAHDLGGTFCRTVKFESQSGMLHVSKPQIKQYKTY
jgi:chemotaxis protein CheD